MVNKPLIRPAISGGGGTWPGGVGAILLQFALNGGGAVAETHNLLTFQLKRYPP